MLKDHVLGAISAAVLGLVEATYIYIVTQGGNLAISFSGLSITVEFKLLVYPMMAQPLLGTVKQVYDMINKSSAQPITMIEAVG